MVSRHKSCVYDKDCQGCAEDTTVQLVRSVKVSKALHAQHRMRVALLLLLLQHRMGFSVRMCLRRILVLLVTGTVTQCWVTTEWMVCHETVCRRPGSLRGRGSQLSWLLHLQLCGKLFQLSFCHSSDSGNMPPNLLTLSSSVQLYRSHYPKSIGIQPM